jgi:hypothetical protein
MTTIYHTRMICNGFGHIVTLKKEICSFCNNTKKYKCNECHGRRHDYTYHSDHIPCYNCGSYGSISKTYNMKSRRRRKKIIM